MDTLIKGKLFAGLKRGPGEWLIAKRIITSTSGLAPFFQGACKDR